MDKRFIVIDGNDGSGKTVQTGLLIKYLQDKGIKTHCLDFPNYDSPTGKVIKAMLEGRYGKDIMKINPYAASMAYAIDRYFSFLEDDGRRVKEFEEADVVVANRYATSNFIHQGAKIIKDIGVHKDLNEVLDVFINQLKYNEYVLFNLPQPTDVVYLYADLEISNKLIQERNAKGDSRKDDIAESNNVYRINSNTAALLSAKIENWITIFCSTRGDNNSVIMRPPLEISNEIITRLGL